ncbi:RidA family protein [Fodinicurvata sp. EGI_FJ10296]|uniref:RidA family protein n=1 Tax=Fodinicurvata sp. EGI_FJ10296 TaxID=3231908 RepID=UPI003454FF44
MTRYAITSGSRFEAMAGYSRAVVDGDWIFVSGTAGYDFETGAISDDAHEQAVQCLATIRQTLQKADADLADIVRLRVYLADRADLDAVCRVLAGTFDDPRPTNTTIVCMFAVEEIRVEIEVTALRRSRGQAGNGAGTASGAGS